MTPPDTANKCDTCAYFRPEQMTARCAVGYGGLHIAHIMASGLSCKGWSVKFRPACHPIQAPANTQQEPE